ncbi:hypothetical protein [Gallaecimonas mangrovi]|uniref:hypothetical protein n=1 Tax=Gallaecimonas mangrovi TaxID=2291597 RepID=UPI001D01341F|nr:hypothetical protein [Gallaecimonas mangrovi]
MIELVNSFALVIIGAAWILSKDSKRLVSLIIANYLIWYAMEFSLTHFKGSIHVYSIGDSYYLLQALREVIILAFLLDAWFLNKARPAWCKAYLIVISVSITLNVIMAIDASTEVGHIIAGKNGFRFIHYQVNRWIPFAEIIIAWGSSNNAISRFFSRWRKPKPETPPPL